MKLAIGLKLTGCEWGSYRRYFRNISFSGCFFDDFVKFSADFYLEPVKVVRFPSEF